MSKKALIAAVVISLITISLCAGFRDAKASSGDYWTAKAPMLHFPGQFTGSATVLDGNIYAVTTAPNQSATGRAIIGYLEVYNPISNSWEEKSIVPANIGSCAVAASGGKIYVIGTTTDSGGTITYFNAAYDPATDTWENKTALTQVFWDMQANVVDGKIYFISGGQWHGFGNFAATQTNYVYDPSNDSWSERAVIPTPVAFYASAVMNDKIYIMGGQSQYTYPSSHTYVNLVQIYDPETDSWTQGTPLPCQLESAAACSTTGALAEKRIYVVGGMNGSDPSKPTLNSTLIYDGAGSWSTGASMPTARWGLTLVNVNDTLYALGGEADTNWLTTNEMYTPANYGEEASPSPSPTLQPTIPTSPTLPPLNDSTPTPPPSPTPSPTQEPTLRPNTQPENFTATIIIVTLVAAVVVVAALAYSAKLNRRKSLSSKTDK